MTTTPWRGAPRLALLLALVTSSGCVVYSERAEIRDEKALDFAGVRKVVLETENGRVQVKCSERLAQPSIELTRFAMGVTREQAKEGAESVRVDVERDSSPGVLHIAARVPTGLWRRSAGCHFEVEMPEGMDLEIRTSNGKVSVEGARGSVRIKTSNGAIAVEDLEGELDATTSNGAIRLEGIDASVLSASTSNGAIQARDIAGEPTLKTSNGSVSLSLRQAPSRPRILVKTSNGSIRLEVPSSLSARVSLHTSNGAITRSFDGCDVSDLESSRGRVRAVLNGGEGEIEAVTSNGAIHFEMGR